MQILPITQNRIRRKTANDSLNCVTLHPKKSSLQLVSSVDFYTKITITETMLHRLAVTDASYAKPVQIPSLITCLTSAGSGLPLGKSNCCPNR